MLPTPELYRPAWKAYRIIPSHYPPIDLFERLYDTDEERELIFEIEAMTNDRLLNEAGNLSLVGPDERISGPGASPVMAAFTHLGFGSRFSNELFGAYYAGDSLETAVRETVFHKEREMKALGEESIELTMRVYIGEVTRTMHDIRPQAYDSLHNADLGTYGETQAFAARWRNKGSSGLLYRSVRNLGGECIAALRPKAVSIPRQGPHLKYYWDGMRQKITNWVELGKDHPLQ